jgi:cholesterol transport system auxiliary component
MKIGVIGTIWVAMCLCVLSGCALVSPVEVEAKKHVLDKIPIDTPSEKTHPATLLVLAPETEPIYDTTQMAYMTRAHEVGYFSQNEWAETPSRMMQPLIVQTIRNTHRFSEVVSPPHFGHHTYALRTEIQELRQDFTSDPATLRLALRFQLSRETTNQLIATKELSVQEAMLEKTPYAGVVAANDATAKLLRELAKFIVEMAD